MSKRSRTVRIGTCGVDAGLIMIGDPCYIIGNDVGRKPWPVFLTDLYKHPIPGVAGLPKERGWNVMSLSSLGNRAFPAALVVSSGYGDGEYPVSVRINDEGVITSMTIRFS